MNEQSKRSDVSVEDLEALNQFGADVLQYHGKRLGDFIDTLNLNELIVLVGYILGQVVAQDDQQRVLPAIMRWTMNFAAAFPGMWEEVAPGKPLPTFSTSSPTFLHVMEPSEDLERPRLDFYIKPETTTVQ